MRILRWLLSAAMLPGLAFGQSRQDGGQDGTLKASLWDGTVLVAEITAESATLSPDQDHGRPFAGELRGGHIIYYTQPRTPDEKSQKVELKFGSAAVDGRKMTFALRDGVDVTMEDGSTVKASDLHLDYFLQQLTTRSPVSISRLNATMTGIGFEADDVLRQLVVLRDGALEISGNPSDLAIRGSTAPPPPSDLRTLLRCTGPLSIKDLSVEIPGPRKFTMIAARDGVRIERLERDRRYLATADSAVIYYSQARDPSTGNSPKPASATLRGSIRIEDFAGASMTADRLDWDAQDDLMRLTGAPFVEVVQTGQRVRARTALIDRWSGRAAFRGDLEGTFSPSGAGAMSFTAAELEILGQPLGGRLQPTEIRASGDVVLHSEGGEKVGRIEARGSAFSWNTVENRGVLRGLPYARIDQGENHIDAPEVLFEGRTMLIVKGPKRLRFVRVDEEGHRTEVIARSVGDVSYDGVTRQVDLHDRCEVVTDEMSLAADRLFLRTAEDGKGVADMRGFGNVRVERPGMRFLGDAMKYRPQERKVEIRGEPYVVASFQGFETLNAAISLDLNQNTIELVGGRYGGRIELPR